MPLSCLVLPCWKENYTEMTSGSNKRVANEGAEFTLFSVFVIVTFPLKHIFLLHRKLQSNYWPTLSDTIISTLHVQTWFSRVTVDFNTFQKDIKLFSR